MELVTDAIGKTLTYGYDVNGNRKSVKISPDNDLTTYTFDDLNRVDLVTHGGEITDYDFYRNGLKKDIKYPNGSVASYGYDSANRLTSITNKQGVADVSSYTYTYDANSNRKTQTEINGGAAELTTYTYDLNDRLETVDYPDALVTYGYDEAYNRTTETAVEKLNSTTVVDKTYSYNPLNRLTGITDNLDNANNVTYQYDVNGNQVLKSQNGVNSTFIYDVRDQLISLRQGATVLGDYGYDYQGLRTSKTDATSTRRYTYDEQSVLLQSDSNGQTLATYRYGPDQLLSLDHSTEGQQYYLFDGLGSVVNLTKPDGSLQARYQYDAWGNTRAQTGTSANPFGFTGHEKDNESGLYYFKARYYDASLGRFLSQDSYLGETNTPPSLHRYLYAYANPTVYIDLDGYCGTPIFGPGGAMVVIPCPPVVATGTGTNTGENDKSQAWLSDSEKEHISEFTNWLTGRSSNEQPQVIDKGKDSSKTQVAPVSKDEFASDQARAKQLREEAAYNEGRGWNDAAQSRREELRRLNEKYGFDITQAPPGHSSGFPSDSGVKPVIKTELPSSLRKGEVYVNPADSGVYTPSTAPGRALDTVGSSPYTTPDQSDEFDNGPYYSTQKKPKAKKGDVEQGADGPFSWVDPEGGDSNRKNKRNWEKRTGKKWPTDPNTGKSQDYNHDPALADGGPGVDQGKSGPKTRSDHIKHHENDRVRWGKRTKKYR